jgi:hypothetical protein
MKAGANATPALLDSSQFPAQAQALAADVLLYCLDRLTEGNRILLLSVGCRNYENYRNCEISL